MQLALVTNQAGFYLRFQSQRLVVKLPVNTMLVQRDCDAAAHNITLVCFLLYSWAERECVKGFKSLVQEHKPPSSSKAKRKTARMHFPRLPSAKYWVLKLNV